MNITEKDSILFVDSDHNQLKSLKRALHDHQDRWQLHFAENATSAIELLQQTPVDIIVTETKLNGSDGSSLLQAVQSQFPGTTRLLFSGQALRTPAQEVVHHAHQFIAKPCHTKDLINNLERVFQLRGLLNNPAMEEMINGLGTLPSLPKSYREMVDALQSENTSLADIGKIASQDIGMSTKLLQMVNSAFFGLPQKIASPEHAVSLLGIETVSNLALGAGVFSQLDQAVIESFQLESLWEHSQSISGLVRRLAQLQGMSRQEIEIPVMAGLLHDLGKLVLASQNTKEYQRIVEQSMHDKIPLFEAEADALWCHHAGIGAYLMGIWGLPFSAVEAVALHHSPDKQTLERPDCLLVYGANQLYHWLGDDPYKEHYNPEHLQSLLGPEAYDRWVVATKEYLDGQTI